VGEGLLLAGVLIGVQEGHRSEDLRPQRGLVQAERGHGDGAHQGIGQLLVDVQLPTAVDPAADQGGDVGGDPDAGASAGQGRIDQAPVGRHLLGR
jgi:hypothetical protein